MLRKYAGYTGEDLDDLIEELEEEAYLGPLSVASWDESKRTAYDELVPLKESVYLDLYESAAGHPYVESRGISRATARKLQLMVDPCDPADGEERILFPVFGPEGELYGLSGRATNSSANLKVRDYFGLKKSACVLGAHLITRESPDKVLVVEGLFDYANAWQCGLPAVAVMHSSMTERQADILRGFSLPTYLFYDDDAAGAKGVQSAGELLYRYVPTMRVRYPEIWVEDEENPESSHYVKDPGELESIDFSEMISDAILWV
jgi:DNA primase